MFSTISAGSSKITMSCAKTPIVLTRNSSSENRTEPLLEVQRLSGMKLRNGRQLAAAKWLPSLLQILKHSCEKDSLTCKQANEDGEMLVLRDDFFQPYRADPQFRCVCGKIGIAFIGHRDNGASLSHGEIGAGHSR